MQVANIPTYSAIINNRRMTVDRKLTFSLYVMKYIYIFTGQPRYATLSHAPLATEYVCFFKPRFVMSGTLIFAHNSQNMTYFITTFGMRKFFVVP